MHKSSFSSRYLCKILNIHSFECRRETLFIQSTMSERDSHIKSGKWPEIKSSCFWRTWKIRFFPFEYFILLFVWAQWMRWNKKQFTPTIHNVFSFYFRFINKNLLCIMLKIKAWNWICMAQLWSSWCWCFKWFCISLPLEINIKQVLICSPLYSM